MATLTINGKPTEASLIKLRPDQVQKARTAASRDGVDNVFFELGRDTYVASGRSVADKVKEWNVVELNGELGRVSHVNTGGVTKGNIVMGSLVGGGAMVGSGLTLGALFKFFPPVREFAMFAAIGLVGGAAIMGITKFFSDRAATKDKLSKFGTAVQ